MTLTGLHSSSSCPGRTDKQSDISIWLASVHTPCESNRLVRNRQFCAAIIKKHRIQLNREHCYRTNFHQIHRLHQPL